jgi:hypothetical protein
VSGEAVGCFRDAVVSPGGVVGCFRDAVAWSGKSWAVPEGAGGRWECGLRSHHSDKADFRTCAKWLIKSDCDL